MGLLEGIGVVVFCENFYFIGKGGIVVIFLFKGGIIYVNEYINFWKNVFYL